MKSKQKWIAMMLFVWNVAGIVLVVVAATGSHDEKTEDAV